MKFPLDLNDSYVGRIRTAWNEAQHLYGLPILSPERNDTDTLSEVSCDLCIQPSWMYDSCKVYDDGRYSKCKPLKDYIFNRKVGDHWMKSA